MSATATAVKTFAIDKTHSEAMFQVRHLVTKVRGRFTDLSGSVAFDEASPERSSAAFTIEAASIDTGTPDRDAHLRSGDFFDVEKYPVITFVSTAIRTAGGDDYDVTGDLTLRGVTKRITLPVAYLGKARDPWGNEKIGFETDITINRKEYGLTWNAALETGGFLVGDDVKISVSIQAAAQPA
jgi:polyisoprenoid-binding protein YceI